MRLFYCDILTFPLFGKQGFLVDKYRLLVELILASKLATSEELLVPPQAEGEELYRVHTAEYVERLLTGNLSLDEIRAVGLPWSSAIIERSRKSVGATIETCRWALKEQIAVHLGGGNHHAYSDHGKGFCWLNDVAIAAQAMIAEGLSEKVLILDCDVHQGDGTASIFRENPAVYTCSLHGAYSYPYNKVPSDLDVELPIGAGDKYYLQSLQQTLKTIHSCFSPDLVIFLAGADVYQDDRFGCLALTQEGIATRDRVVLEWFTALGVPVAVTLAGGYARQIEDSARIHFRTTQIAYEVHRQ